MTYPSVIPPHYRVSANSVQVWMHPPVIKQHHITRAALISSTESFSSEFAHVPYNTSGALRNRYSSNKSGSNISKLTVMISLSKCQSRGRYGLNVWRALAARTHRWSETYLRYFLGVQGGQTSHGRNQRVESTVPHSFSPLV